MTLKKFIQYLTIDLAKTLGLTLKTNINRLHLLVFLIFSITCPVQADVSTWIGQSAGTGDLHEYLIQVNMDSSDESYSTSTGIYELNAYLEGLKFEFTRNMTLKNLDIYRKGSIYNGYSGTLPFGLSWEMRLDSFLFRAEGFESIADNPYRFDRKNIEYTISVYFKNGTVELIRIIGNSKYISDQDMLNKRHWGIRLLPDGNCIDGDCINGIGKMEWPNGMWYAGQFKEGISHGTGTLQNGTLTYSGSWKFGFLWGNGNLVVPNQYDYRGEFLMGKRAGTGKAEFSNKTSYSGAWSEDLMEGKGTFYFSSNYYYTGQMRLNNINGFGRLTSPQGYVEGSFKNGKPHGFAKQFVNTSKTTMEGNWVDGKKQGTFKSYSPLTGNVVMEFEDDELISKIEE
jgi:hypothetical protein